MTTITQQVKLDAASILLRDLAASYYLGCKAYHRTQTGDPHRIQWHTRLKTMTQIGNQLADALLQPRPNWPVLFHIAHSYRQLHRNPLTTHPQVTP